MTFGPGYQQAATIQPLSVAIGAAPSATQLGGAAETGNTVTISTGAAGAVHTLQPGDTVTISGVANAGYNGTFTVDTILTSRAFTYTNPVAGLPRSGGGTVTLVAPGLSESGNTVTVRTAAAHNRSVGDIVVISGAGIAAYNGTFTITSVPTPRSFTYTNATAGLANSGGTTATYSAPFQVRVGGNDSAVIGGSSQAYTAANVQSAINAIPGFAGTATVSGLASTGFTVTYSGASAGVDVANLGLVNLSCGGCFGSVEETNHGGANDSFSLDYNGNVSAPIVNGVNYTAAGVLAALTPILPAGGTATVAGFAGGGFNNTGFQVTFTGGLAATNVPVTLGVQGFSAGASGFVGETDKGGAVDNKGGPGNIDPTGNAFPVVSAPAVYTIPLRTPFALAGSATDVNGDTMTYSWEQNDRGGGAGTALLANTKTNGPLFAMFPKSGQISLADALQYDSPGQNHLTTSPARVFPDLQQIIDNNTNAETGGCPIGPIAPPVPQNITECFAEFLPTSDYVGFTGINATPLSLHFRLTARDGRGGVNSGDTTVLLANIAGPFLVTSPNTAVTYKGGTTQTVTWSVAGTNTESMALNVKISLSTDGGHTYPYVLAGSTPNDGSQSVTLPNVGSGTARVKVEAVDNIFFDISNADFAIQAVPVVTNSLGEGGSQSVQYSDSLNPDLTVTATDPDTLGKDLTASASGLPAGLSLSIVSTTGDSTLPGSRTWKVAGTTTAAPAAYPVSVTVTDDTGGTATTTFTINVTKEDADATYAGDMLVFTTPTGSSANVTLRAVVRDSSLFTSDTEAGDIRNATVTFKEGATVLCGPTAAALINGATTTGTASCTVSLGLGAHTISIYINNYYTAPVADGVVEVAQPNGSFVTGGGYHRIVNSSGSYKADPNSKLNFGFNVNYKNKKALQGHATITFRAGGHTYQLKSTAIDSLGIALKTGAGTVCAGPPSATCYGVADFRSKANLTDVTDPAHPVTISGNLALQVTMTDKGDPGSSDTIAVTAWNGNTLVFSSEWNGAKTVEGLLDGGNLVVH